MDVTIQKGVSLATQLADLTRRRTAYNAAELHLYQSSFTPDENSAIAAFTAAEATFVGYAEIVLAMTAIGPDADGGFVSYSQSCFFQATDATAPNLIGGAWIQTAAGVLLEFWPFPTPVGMDIALANLTCQLQQREPQPDGMLVET